jgi:hypothetical protein
MADPAHNSKNPGFDFEEAKITSNFGRSGSWHLRFVNCAKGLTSVPPLVAGRVSDNCETKIEF